MPLSVYQRDLQIATIIATDILDWEWTKGGWYKNDVFQTDFFDPMNDDAQAEMLLTLGMDIKITEKLLAIGTCHIAESPNDDKELTGYLCNTLWVSCGSRRAAICFLLCMMTGDDPARWDVDLNNALLGSSDNGLPPDETLEAYAASNDMTEVSLTSA